MTWDFDLTLKKKKCKYCKAEFQPTGKRNVRCIRCQGQPSKWLKQKYGTDK